MNSNLDVCFYGEKYDLLEKIAIICLDSQL